MTYSELQSAVITLADDPALSSSDVGEWINANYRTLLREREWPFLVGNGTYTTTSGTQEKEFSAFNSAILDFAKPLRVWIASSSTSEKTLLTPVNYEERFTPGLTNAYYVTPDNLSIGLVPTPTNSTTVVTVDYLKKTTDLSDDDDEPVFLSDFHWILVWKALMNYQFQQREASDEFRVQYEEILDRMVRFYFNPQGASTVSLSRGLNKVYRVGTSDPLHLS